MAGKGLPEAEPSLRKNAFLSYSSSDAEFAHRLCAYLETKGIRCWIAPREVTPGRPYADECVRGIEASDSFVLLASAEAIASVQVISEVEQAHKREKPIYTVLIGKPNVARELDFYVSRLHWIESGSMSFDQLADKLAAVLGSHKRWEAVASPPSLRRTVLYRRDAFMGSALAVILILGVIGGGLAYWLNRRVALDSTSLGHVSLSTQPPDGQAAMRVYAQVWLAAEGVRFRDLRLLTTAERAGGGVERGERSGWPIPGQVGSHEVVNFPLPVDTGRLTTCLIVPSPGLHAPYRVIQEFAVSNTGSGTDRQVILSPAAETRVRKEDGSPCNPLP